MQQGAVLQGASLRENSGRRPEAKPNSGLEDGLKGLDGKGTEILEKG